MVQAGEGCDLDTLEPVWQSVDLPYTSSCIETALAKLPDLQNFCVKKEQTEGGLVQAKGAI